MEWKDGRFWRSRLWVNFLLITLFSAFREENPNQFSISLSVSQNILRKQKEMFSILDFTKSEENYYTTTTITISTSERHPYVNLSSGTSNAFSHHNNIVNKSCMPVRTLGSQAEPDGDGSASAPRRGPRDLGNTAQLPFSPGNNCFWKLYDSENSAFVQRKAYLRRQDSFIFNSMDSRAQLIRSDSCLQSPHNSEHYTRYFLYSILSSHICPIGINTAQ